MDGVAAAFARRSAALCLSVSCQFRMSNSAPSSLVETIIIVRGLINGKEENKGHM